MDSVDYVHDRRPVRVVVVMGVSGSGKSTVGARLAEQLGSAAFIDADDLHPSSNKDKMSRGQALGDKDRWPWLQRVREEISKAVKQALDQEDSKQRYVVCACSALKGSYRELLSQSNTMDDLSEDAVFLYIDVAKEELARRLSERQQGKGHFFNPQLLDSQLETLERPDTTREAAICISGEGKSIGEVADEAYRLLVARE